VLQCVAVTCRHTNVSDPIRPPGYIDNTLFATFGSQTPKAEIGCVMNCHMHVCIIYMCVCAKLDHHTHCNTLQHCCGCNDKTPWIMCVAVCCNVSVWRCVAVCCSALQCVAVCCRELNPSKMKPHLDTRSDSTNVRRCCSFCNKNQH